MSVTLITTIFLVVYLSIWNLDFRMETVGNHHRIIISAAFNTLISPPITHLPHSALYQRHDVIPDKSDDLPPKPVNNSSQGIKYIVSRFPNKFASTHSLKYISEVNPSPHNDRSRMSSSSPIYIKDHCVKLMQGTAKPSLLQWAAHHHPPKGKERQYIDPILRSCDEFLHNSDYIHKPLNSQEESFPIAYSIVMYKDPAQVERLLHAIYRPQNHYCIHVDSKVSNPMTSNTPVRHLCHCINPLLIVGVKTTSMGIGSTILLGKNKILFDYWNKATN